MPAVRPRRALAASLATVAALALSACNNDDAPKAEPSSSQPAGKSTGATDGGVEPAGIKLLEAGATPRRVVQLDVEKGHEEWSTLRLSTTTEVDFMSSPPVTVPMTIPFTTTVADVTDDEVTVDVRYGKATVTGGGLQKAMLAQARKAVGHLDGVTARVVYSRSGTVVSRDVELGDDAPDLVGRILEDVAAQGFALAVPFPTEEVGVGARWQADSAVRIGGTRATVTSTYELTELTDDGYTVTVSSTQTAVPGATVAGKVVDGSSTATGTVRGRAGLLGPLESTSSGKGDTTVEVGGQRVKTTFEVRLRATTR